MSSNEVNDKNEYSLVDVFVFLTGLTSFLLIVYKILPYWVNRFAGGWLGFSAEYKLFSCWLRGCAGSSSGQWGAMIFALGLGYVSQMLYDQYKRNGKWASNGCELGSISRVVVYVLLFVFVIPSLF